VTASGELQQIKCVAFVGGGNMAEAIARGLLASGMRPEQLRASDPLESRRTWLAGQLGIRTFAENAAVLEGADLAVLAVKPQHLGGALGSLPAGARPLILSIVAGATLASLRRQLGAGARVVRSMPNTPALIGAGISAIAVEPESDPSDLARAEAVLGAVGRVVRVPEALMDAVTGLSGSGPAYVYLFIEALTEAGLREGLPLATARELATWTALGSARMLAESGESPAALRERVTSPGGTTIAGLAALEAGGLRSALFAAVRAATQRSRELA
jgi:pyrroline-5-carboxylate reductase